jgi:putative methionine-R-sulfoxide reductase with GAF domain
MEKYTILAPAAPAPRKNDPTATPAPAGDVTQAEAVVQEHHRTPETPEARRERIHWELDATLQLLAERAHYITGATGAAIALVDGDAMLCRASIGETAPPVGARLQLDSGVSGEAVRTRAVIRCDEASSDARVNRETCQALGIESILVMPLIRKEQVIGIFELFSSKARAFSERDVVTLQRMDEMLGTAMMQADAAEGRVESSEETVQAEPAESGPHIVAEPAPAGEEPAQASVGSVVASSSEKAANADSASGESLATMPTQAHDGTTATIHRCTVCGFPVSGGRTLCLDCSKKVTSPASGSDQTGTALPAFLSDPDEEELKAEDAGIGSWLGKHKYLFGTLFLAVLVIVALLWIR